MPGIIPDSEKLQLLASLMQVTISVHFYTNDVTPSETSTVASFDEVKGQAFPIILNPANWVFSPPNTAVYPTQMFVFGFPPLAPKQVFGMYYKEVTTGKLLGAVRIAPEANPFIPVQGSTITFTPQARIS